MDHTTFGVDLSKAHLDAHLAPRAERRACPTADLSSGRRRAHVMRRVRAYRTREAALLRA